MLSLLSCAIIFNYYFYLSQIRNTDIPERMQLRDTPVTPEKDEKLEEESEWIFKQAFSKPTVSTQVHYYSILHARKIWYKELCS